MKCSFKGLWDFPQPTFLYSSSRLCITFFFHECGYVDFIKVNMKGKTKFILLPFGIVWNFNNITFSFAWLYKAKLDTYFTVDVFLITHVGKFKEDLIIMSFAPNACNSKSSESWKTGHAWEGTSCEDS